MSGLVRCIHSKTFYKMSPKSRDEKLCIEASVLMASLNSLADGRGGGVIHYIYTRIRTNSTKLSPSPYSVISDICEKCDTPQTVNHLLLHCETYKKERDKFKTQLRNSGCHLDPTSNEFYKIMMTLDVLHIPDRSKHSVIPIILSFVGVVGRIVFI